MAFVSYCPKSSPKPLFEQKENQHPILNPCARFELNWLRNKKVGGKTHFRWNEWVELGSEIRNDAYSDSAYDVTNFFVVLRSSWPILYSYQISLLLDTNWQS